MSKSIFINKTDLIWATTTLLTVLIIAVTFIMIQPISFSLTGKWNGDIQVNKVDPHWGVKWMGMDLDKSTSLQVTGVDFELKGTVPAFVLWNGGR